MFEHMLKIFNTLLFATLLVLITNKQDMTTAYASFHQLPSHPTVEELTEASLLKTINQPHTNLWLIAFYDPSCPHSQSLLPILDDIASTTSSMYQMSIGKVDCSAQNQKLCEEYDIKAYPTLKWYRDGDFHEYDNYNGGGAGMVGGRYHDEFVLFAKQMNGPIFKKMDSIEDVLESIDHESSSNGSTFILYKKSSVEKGEDYDHDEDQYTSQALQTLEKVARQYQDKNTFIALNPSAQNDKWVKQYTSLNNMSIILMKIEKDTNPVIFRSTWSLQLLSHFIEANKEKIMPLVNQYTLHKYGLQRKNLVIAILDLDQQNNEGTIEDTIVEDKASRVPTTVSPSYASSLKVLAMMRHFASTCSLSLRKEYRFVYMNGRDLQRNDMFFRKFSLSFEAGDHPQLFVLDYPHDIYWAFENATTTTELSKANVERFLHDIMKGEILSKNPNVDMNVKDKFTEHQSELLGRMTEKGPWELRLNMILFLVGFVLLIPPSTGRVYDLIAQYIWQGLIDPLLIHLGLLDNDGDLVLQEDDKEKKE